MAQNQMQQVKQSILLTLSPDPNLRKPAEKFIEQCESQDGFSKVLLEILEHSGEEITLKLSAAIVFKNFIRKYWAYKDDSIADRISLADRNYIKSMIVDLMLRSDEQIQRQLIEAVSIIGREDFPAKWQNLLGNMVQRVKEACSSYNFIVINGVLQTANSLFARYEYEYKSEELWTEIKFVLDAFAQPFTELFVWIVKLVPEHMNNPANIKIIFNSLYHCAKIFYSLNYQDLPEYFEDNISIWMSHFVELLLIDNKSISRGNKEEASVLENLKSQICENVGMYAEKYNEEFEPYLAGFIQQIWNLLGSLNNEVRYDLLASNAIRFLSIVAERGVHKEIFEKEQVLNEISSKIIIPNMEFRECDEELFEDDPEEYIRRDIEGADVYTRRRAACDFVKALAKHFEKPMTDVFSRYIESMLRSFAANESQNWKSKNAAIYLVTSLAVKGGSVRLGTTSTSDLINISDFFANVIRPDLERPDINQLPVLKADALKYIITFRNQIPLKEVIIPMMPQLIRHLSTPIIVIHSYAANCIEKLLTLRDPAQKSLTLVKPDDIQPFILPLIEGLFGILQHPGSSENDYVIKAILRLLSLLRERLLPYFNVILPKIAEKLNEVSKNPSKPNFNHCIFEIVGLSVRIACESNPKAVTSFEPIFFPIFQNILVQDVQEFMPYVFQIFSQFLEMYSNSNEAAPEPYLELFAFLLMPPLWEKPPCIAPLSRLLQGYVRNCSKQIVSMGKLEPLLGVFQKLIASKTNDHLGFNILNYLILFTEPTALSSMMKQVFFLIFQRLTASKTFKYVKSLIVFFSIFIYKYGAKALFDMIESIQANMFSMVIEKLFIADGQKVTGNIDRKTVSVGISKLLTDLDDQFLTGSLLNLWAPLLQTAIAIFELPEDTSNKNEEHFIEIDENSTGYQACYSQLSFAKNSQYDPIQDIPDPRIYLAQNLSKISQKHQGRFNPLINSMDPGAVDILKKYCTIANVSIY
ncbi:hypothetical protein RDWZM_002654 [Blomia tropicalis]|uniref:Exportin-2 n=1 Tax=Blomia tropicalis TaxID=40697 RepID=A0A9Q0RRS2_BLOTA|nr:hypothetical protein BLOT_001504 [Blomia tropicalis]KAJ6224109.1 hypothetical protein RDWZM_002654 [Blomia tropicalis]